MTATGSDYYAVLGVRPDASEDEIRRAFRRLAHQYHPDHNQDPDAAEQFRKIKEAYQVLSDPDQRLDYDSQLSSADTIDTTDTADTAGNAGDGGSPSPQGEGCPAPGSFCNAPFQPLKPGDVWAQVQLTPEEALSGVQKQVFFTQYATCPDCLGLGSKSRLRCSCPQCRGLGWVTAPHGGAELCPVCRGLGSVPGELCPQCSGSGLEEVMPTSSWKCPSCGGSGLIADHHSSLLCPVCSGSGLVHTDFPVHQPCRVCHGVGTVPGESCPHCGGRGLVPESCSRNIYIPCGAVGGSWLHLKGQGAAVHSGSRGDLYIYIVIAGGWSW